METIIQHIALDLVKKITKKAYSGGINDIDALASDVLVDCRKAASLVIEAIYSQINVQIREDKAERKKLGLVLKEKERKRELLTELGRLSLPRDYYYDRNNGRYVSVLDYITGIRAYERIGNNLSACMVNLGYVIREKCAAVMRGRSKQADSEEPHYESGFTGKRY